MIRALAAVLLFSGAALLPDGSIALLLEPAQLAHPPRGTEPPPGDVAS